MGHFFCAPCRDGHLSPTASTTAVTVIYPKQKPPRIHPSANSLSTGHNTHKINSEFLSRDTSFNPLLGLWLCSLPGCQFSSTSHLSWLFFFYYTFCPWNDLLPPCACQAVPLSIKHHFIMEGAMPPFLYFPVTLQTLATWHSAHCITGGLLSA